MNNDKIISVTFDKPLTMMAGDTLTIKYDYDLVVKDVLRNIEKDILFGTEPRSVVMRRNVDTKTYVGIGSRNTPTEIQAFMRFLGYKLAREGWTLRSGGAPGADSAFEEGCDDAGGKKEIYLPWPNFNGRRSKLDIVLPGDLVIAKKYHPAWEKLSPAAQKIHGRNVRQVLGKRPTAGPVLPAFLVCWTKNGKDVGGTAQALRIARDNSVPIFNVGYKELEIPSGEWTPITSLGNKLGCDLLLEFKEWRK